MLKGKEPLYIRNNYIEQIDRITKDLKEELQNFLFLKHLKNLVNKLNDKQFDEEKEKFDRLLEALKVVSRDYNRKNRKFYMTHFNEIKKRVIVFASAITHMKEKEAEKKGLIY